jgi:hypothetical protein
MLSGCGRKPAGEIVKIDKLPDIEPDYSGVTIPSNIAPLNFNIKQKSTAYYVNIVSDNGAEINISSANGKILIPAGKWKNMLKNNAGRDFRVDIFIKDEAGRWAKFKSIVNKIAREPIDLFVYYRLLYPGYESWKELSINYRNLENFKSESFIENSVADQNCVNCHSFNNGKTDDFLFHMRGTMGGTYFYKKGQFKKMNLKTGENKNGAVYPRWHPSGKFVAFSSNKIIQRFHAADNKKIEVSDLESTLLLYDLEKNEIMNIDTIPDVANMDTYPEWSPDGKWLYFCRAGQIGKDYDFKKIFYNLFRIPFDIDKRKFGQPELMFDAAQINKSASFPRVSPDNRFLVFTMADYGCFPIWHKEADLYSLNLSDQKVSKLDLNSEYCDSYHSWSSNGRWLIFSSKRGDGLTARPFISYIEENGISDKPFILPQKDPAFYNEFLKSFNIPEFSTIRIKMSPGRMRRLAGTNATQAIWHQEKIH